MTFAFEIFMKEAYQWYLYIMCVIHAEWSIVEIIYGVHIRK